MSGRNACLYGATSRFCSHAVSTCSTDNFLSSIPVFDWLIFCCTNLILHQKKTENDKSTYFLMKNSKTKNKKSIYKYKLAFFVLNSPPLTRNVTYFKF